MSNVLSTKNKVPKNKVPNLLKDTFAVIEIIKGVMIDFAVLASDDIKASPLNDGIPAMTEF